ncbi:MAG TPA: GLPGLI family protein [Chitinophagaceae bacterium]|nr:GLPGLI family protein [Chitinophagaceae bacterium]
MKTVLLFLLVLSVSANAQNLKIEYQVRFNDMYDRGRNDRLHTGYLLISGGLSRYFTIEKEKYKPKNEHDILIMPDTANQVFINMSTGMLVSQESDIKGKTFFVSDSLYPMKWEIGSEERKIDSLKCVRAECNFRGRKYIAWFTTEIPLPYGPWKMGGLPGLIVDLQDSDENMLVKLKSISNQEQSLAMPSVIKYSKEEHVAEIRKLLKRIKDNARASSTGDCVTCQQQSVVEFFAWEKIPQ